MGFKDIRGYSKTPRRDLEKIICLQCGAVGYVRPLRDWAKKQNHYCCDPCKEKVKAHVRRAKKYNNGPIEFIGPELVYNRDGWVCAICGEPVDRDLKHPDPESASLDHIIPLSIGGTHTWENVQLAHLRCNIEKRDNISI